MALTIQSFSGSDAAPFFDDLARLRTAVFRAFPYLYEGNPVYEQTYLSTYAKSEGSVFVIARDGDAVVGVATGTPMAGETDEVKRPFIEANLDPKQFFYFGESVLMPAYRGQGIGIKFFEGREAQAKRLGLRYATFCAVERPLDHPRRPVDYAPLDAFWAKRGYTHHPALRTTFSWRDLDETVESPKPLSFWIRDLKA